MRIKRYIILCIFSVLAISIYSKDVVIQSPDKKYNMVITDEDGYLHYSLKWNGKEKIMPSLLGIFANRSWNDGLFIDKVNFSIKDTTWVPVYGERSKIRDNYAEYELHIGKFKTKDKLILDVRAYNEGMAFRYRFPGGQYLKIEDEYTEYSMPEGTLAYFTPKAQTEYVCLPIDSLKGETERPLLMKNIDGSYTCIGEAQVVDYVRTKYVLADNKKGTLRAAMYGPVEDIAPYYTPWRYVMCANTPGEILENNDLLLNLNLPTKIKDVSWIKPGKVMREVTLTTKGGKEVIDFAVKHNMQYVLFDAGWYGFEYDKSSDATTVTLDPRRNPDPNALDLQEVIRYGKSKGIGVILYVNQRALQQQLDEILPLYKSWGVAGIKFGFVQVGSQVWTKWMHDAVRKCAEYGLMVDIHDEYRPTGVSRTYPNLMTQEGIRGNEEFPDATHNTILPFTRFVAGAADYTICYYRQDFGRLEKQGDNYGVPRSRTIKTTPAHQLALAVVYYSPFQLLYWYDKPSDSKDEPELKFWDDVYTTWDDTKVLNGEVGEYVTIARQKGEEWFVGSITNNQSRKISFSLGFLSGDREYIAEIYEDSDNKIPTRTKVKTTKCKINNNDSLTFNLKASGGVAIHFLPI